MGCRLGPSNTPFYRIGGVAHHCGREAAQQPEACKHINFKLSKITPRLKSKNIFSQSKYRELANRNTALQTQLAEANATIAELRAKLEVLESEMYNNVYCRSGLIFIYKH